MIPVNEPLLNGNEKKYLMECIDTGWISSEGPFVKKFEEQMAAVVGRNCGVAVTNGSAALDTAVLALELGPGDEVIMPSFTIIACAAAVVRVGAKPVLVDCDPVTWNMDIGQIEAKINKNTRAIMVVHIYGLPVDMYPVLELAKKYELKIIEDAAEMHGQTYKGKPCGGFGDISTFSFYPNKHITTGEGGMVLTNNAELAARCRSIRNLFFKPEKRYEHAEIGYNFRMTNLQAAIGIAQIERLEEFVARKRRMGALYTELLKEREEIELPCSETTYAKNIYWVFGIVLKEQVPLDGDGMIKKLREKGVDCRNFFWPMHKQPVFKNMGLFDSEIYPIAERLAHRGFYIPSGLALNESDIRLVANIIKQILDEVN